MAYFFLGHPIYFGWSSASDRAGWRSQKPTTVSMGIRRPISFSFDAFGVSSRSAAVPHFERHDAPVCIYTVQYDKTLHPACKKTVNYALNIGTFVKKKEGKQHHSFTCQFSLNSSKFFGQYPVDVRFGCYFAVLCSFRGNREQRQRHITLI